MPVSISGTNGVTFPDSSLQAAAASPYVLKNRIINGAMTIDQRNAGASVTAADGVYTLDRWVTYTSQASKFTVQQNAGSVTPPLGYTNYLGITSSSSYSAVSGDYFGLAQFIEGYNVSDLSWGIASAQIITLSFWVRSSLTGTFSVSLANSANNRSYLATYTISSANTWEQKTLTITGDASGTWVTNNGKGIRVWFDLGSGSSYNGTAGSWGASVVTRTSGSQSVVGTSGATFYITGVQLEVGSTATPFERRLYNQELANCQRYCRTIGNDGGTDKGMFSGVAYLTNTIIASYTFPTMRVAPTATITSATFIDVVVGNNVSQSNNTFAISEFTSNSGQPAVTNTGTPYTIGHGAVIRSDGMSMILSAEL
jgi:hypothetical protein